MLVRQNVQKNKTSFTASVRKVLLTSLVYKNLKNLKNLKKQKSVIYITAGDSYKVTVQKISIPDQDNG